jgi:hypothetical protein
MVAERSQWGAQNTSHTELNTSRIKSKTKIINSHKMIPHPTPSPRSKSKQSNETTTGLASATSKIQTTTTCSLSNPRKLR